MDINGKLNLKITQNIYNMPIHGAVNLKTSEMIET